MANSFSDMDTGLGLNWAITASQIQRGLDQSNAHKQQNEFLFAVTLVAPIVIAILLGRYMAYRRRKLGRGTDAPFVSRPSTGLRNARKHHPKR